MAVRRRRGGDITSRTPPLQPHSTFYIWLEFLSSTTDYETQAPLLDRRRSETLPLIGIITRPFSINRCVGSVWDMCSFGTKLIHSLMTKIILIILIILIIRKVRSMCFGVLQLVFACFLFLAYHPLNTWS